MKYKTKEGFGGLLMAGLPCRIVYEQNDSVIIDIMTIQNLNSGSHYIIHSTNNGHLFKGRKEDLQEL